MSRFIQESNILDEPRMRLGTEQIAETGVLERTDVHLRATRAVVFRSLEEVNQFPPPIVNSHECTVFVDRPGDGMTGNLEIGFDVAHQLERIFAGAITLVDECENRHAAPLTNAEELPGSVLDALAVVEQHDGA